MKKLVDIKELKNHEQEYQKYYQKYCTAQWEFPIEESWYVDGLNEQHKWLEVESVYYNVSYSQGDFAYFTGRVLLDKFLDEFDPDDEYFVLREAMKLKDCVDFLDIESNRKSWAHFCDIEWLGTDDGYFEDEDVVLKYRGVEHRSILEGMNYREYYDLCMEQTDNLYTWVKEVCENMFKGLYYDIRDDIDHQTSEESFEEWAESMDEQFEIEIVEEAA